MVAGLSNAQIAEAVGKIRFDRHLERFEFKPSLGIVAKQLEKLGEELQDMREPLTDAVKDIMQYSILENFMSGGRPEKWEGLTRYTVKRRNGKAEPILVWTGALAEGGSSPSIWSIGKQTAVIRDLPQKIWYGKVHQSGIEGTSDGEQSGNWMDKYRSEAKKLAPRANARDIDKLAMKLSDPIFRKKQGLSASSSGGGSNDTATVPARPWAMFQEEDIDNIEIIFALWIEEKVDEFARRG